MQLHPGQGSGRCLIPILTIKELIDDVLRHLKLVGGFLTVR
jgi:hypothetical protein